MEIKITNLEARRCALREGATYTVRRIQLADHVRRAGYFVTKPNEAQSGLVDEQCFVAASECEVVE